MKKTKRIPLSQIRDKEAREKERRHRQGGGPLPYFPGQDRCTGKCFSLDDYDRSPDAAVEEEE